MKPGKIGKQFKLSIKPPAGAPKGWLTRPAVHLRTGGWAGYPTVDATRDI